MPTDIEVPRGIKFSLKTFLFGFIAVGVVAGVMGRLLFRHPETFMIVLSLVSTGVPFLLAVITIFWIGFKGKWAWAASVCAECKNELRGTKPEKRYGML